MSFNRINNIFRGDSTVSKPNMSQNRSEVANISSVTPDFNVRVPQMYNKLSVERLSNGQEIHCYKLANGQKVMIAPMKTPKTYVNTYVNTGAMNEKDSERGISHFNEHMVFNGTFGTNGYMKLGVGDVFRKVEEMGGYTNACTSTGQTSYTIGVPNFDEKNLETAIQIQSAMMNNCSMPDDMVDKEHYPVCSEINMYSDVVPIKSNNIAIKNLYNIQSTSEDLVAGRVDNIQNIDRQKVMDYYKNNYYPANMTTVITGDVNPDEAIALVAKHFRGKNKPNPERCFEKLNPITKTQRVDMVYSKAKATNATIAFNGPENNNMKDQLALEVAFDILFGKSNSRISAPLKEMSTEVSPSMSKFGTLPTDGQVMTIDLETNEENSEKALRKVFSELKNFTINNQEELEAVKLKKLSNHQDKYEDAEGVNMLIGSNSFDFGVSDISKIDDVIKSLTVQDVENAVKKYFDTSKASIAVVHPTSVTQESLNKNYNNSLSFKGSRVKDSAPIVLSSVSRNVLNNNYDIAFYDTPTNQNTKIGIKYTSNKPIYAKPGTYELLNRMLLKKTAYKDVSEYGDYLDKYGLEHSIEVSNDGSITINGNMPSGNVDKFLKIAQEQLMLPLLNDEATLEKQKGVVKNIISNSKADVIEGISKTFYGNTPLGYTNAEILANIDNVTMNDVRQLYYDIMSNASATVSVAGPISSGIKDVVNNSFAQMPVAQPNLHNTHNLYKPIDKGVVTTVAEPNSQADIVQAYNFKTTDNVEDEVKFTLMNGILSKGDTTGLFNNLREKEKLAYAVNSNYETIGDNSVIYCRIMTTTDNSDTNEHTYENVQKSINGFTRQIEKMKNGEFTDKELEVAKKELKIGLKEASHTQSQKQRVLIKGLNSGYGAEFLNKKYEIIDKITKEDIQNAAKYAFSGKPVYSIVASQNTIDANKDFLNSLQK